MVFKHLFVKTKTIKFASFEGMSMFRTDDMIKQTAGIQFWISSTCSCLLNKQESSPCLILYCYGLLIHYSLCDNMVGITCQLSNSGYTFTGSWDMLGEPCDRRIFNQNIGIGLTNKCSLESPVLISAFPKSKCTDDWTLETSAVCQLIIYVVPS